MMKKPSLLLVFAALFALCGLPLPSAFAQMDPSIQMVLGNPDGASNGTEPNPKPYNREKYLIQRLQYAMSFNDTLHFPNWVAWHLAAADLGSSGRAGSFAPDNELPSDFTVVVPSDYSNTGFDRGHNCPSGDRTKTPMDNAFTFRMSNITPQETLMNTGPWAALENYCRTLVGGSRELMIYCGHGFGQGYAPTPPHTPIGPKSIPVPDFAWKIIVVVPAYTQSSPITETDLLERVTMRTRVIAVIMNNDTSVRGKSWPSFITTVKDIEAKTGLVFFDKLNPKTAAVLKAKKDSGN